MSPSSADASVPAPPLAPKSPGLVLAFLCIAQFMVFLDVSIVNVALPSLQRGLDISPADLTYVVTAYGTILGGCLLLGSRLADKFGRRRLLQIGLALFGLSSLVGGASQDAILLFICRGVQGLGSAMIAPAALSTLTVTFAEGEARNKALGVWGGLAGIASVAGVVFGGLLTEGPGWRWIFFINVPIAAAAVLLAPRILPESRGERRPFDIPGAVVITGGLMLLIYSLDEAITYGWGSARVLPTLVAAGVLILAFLVIEQRKRDPLVPFTIFRVPTLRTANVTTVFFLGGVVSLFYFASLYMQQVLGYSPIETGLAYVPQAVMAGVGAGLASQLVTKTAAKPVLLSGLVLCTLGLFLLSRAGSDASYPADILPAYLIFGLGMGFSFVPLQIAAQAGVPDRQAGLAAGLINTSQELGGALGLAVAATIALHNLPEKMTAAGGDPSRLQDTLTGVFHHAFQVGYCLMLAALVLSLLLPTLRAQQGPASGELSDKTAGVNAG
ncbi:MFS transporter [Streptomyces sp. B1866]|uniref:MFS transporter n=1 Tax=Streptomyces sp. B1866 TaxID=3075431 RepID=UPI00288C88C6|nr:MFS transporter [Streptomyces sp. B1866]MDT3397077.1 MFS transporter [Streptomyces sp. B1866]